MAFMWFYAPKRFAEIVKEKAEAFTVQRSTQQSAVSIQPRNNLAGICKRKCKTLSPPRRGDMGA